MTPTLRADDAVMAEINVAPFTGGVFVTSSKRR
jgi:hypothetical protein